MYESNHQNDHYIIPLDADASIKLFFLQFLKLSFITLASYIVEQMGKVVQMILLF